jgi:CubicO group peptidase (beta-lactamase class C family)
MDRTKNNQPHQLSGFSLIRQLRNSMNPNDKDNFYLMKIVRRTLITFLALVLALAMIAAGVYVWALMSTDTSLAARGLIWGGSRFDDWKRFPSRVVRASDTPVTFEAGETDLFNDFPIDGQPLETYLEITNTTAFIVLHDDALLFEGYFNGSSRSATQASLSVAKSFASTLVGIAIEEGFINNLDQPVTAYIPELLERDPRFADITLLHLIMMSSGLRFERDASNPFSDDFITSHSPNMREAALKVEIVEAPGKRYHYNDYNPLLIGIVLERATGMSVSEYLETRLWGPMGAEGDGSWDLDSERSSFERMSVGINGRAIDLAKLGWLFLHEGKVGDRQIVSQAWVEQVTQATDAIYTARADHANYYQNYWFLDVENEAYYAEGNFCQFIYVYPAADLVLVRNGSDCGGTYWTGLLGDIAQAIEVELAH